jgi:hypothetical protein
MTPLGKIDTENTMEAVVRQTTELRDQVKEIV